MIERSRTEANSAQVVQQSTDAALLELLACPCSGRLILGDDGEAVICSACGAHYPTRQGIVDFLGLGLSGREQDQALKRLEMRARDEQATSYDKMMFLRLLSRREIPAVLAALKPEPGDAIFEAGCGTGRLTRVLVERCRRLVAADYSLESLLLCAGKIHGVLLVGADVCSAPLREATFDAIVSCQCLEHLPPEECERAIASWRRALKPTGRLVLTAYHHTWWSRLLGKQEGTHGGQIYFRRFTPQMLQQVLEPHFRLERVRPLGWYLLLASASAA